MSKINLQELTLDNLGQWPFMMKMASIIFLSVLMFLVAYWWMVQKDFTYYGQLKMQEGQLKKEFEFNYYQASSLRNYRSQMVILNKRLKRTMRQLTTKNEMPNLLQDMTQMGIANGLIFELFAPMPEIPHDFYTELPIKIVVVGPYQQLAVFLSHIAAMNRMITLHDFLLKKRMEEQLVMDITAKIYRYNTQ